jgi:hypothetical protein
MRSKVDYKAYLTFNLMIVFVSKKFFRRSKVENNGFKVFFRLSILKNIVDTTLIMRLKVFMHWWLTIRAKYYPQVQLYKFKYFRSHD